MAKKKRILSAKGEDISLSRMDENDFNSLTDIDRRFDDNGRFAHARIRLA